MQREADVCRANTSVPTPSDAPPLPPSLPPESSPNWDPPPVSPCAGEEHSGENSIAMLVARPVRPSQLHRTAFSGGGRRTRSVGSCAGQQECVKDTFFKKKKEECAASAQCGPAQIVLKKTFMAAGEACGEASTAMSHGTPFAKKKKNMGGKLLERTLLLGGPSRGLFVVDGMARQGKDWIDVTFVTGGRMIFLLSRRVRRGRRVRLQVQQRRESGRKMHTMAVL